MNSRSMKFAKNIQKSKSMLMNKGENIFRSKTITSKLYTHGSLESIPEDDESNTKIEMLPPHDQDLLSSLSFAPFSPEMKQKASMDLN